MEVIFYKNEPLVKVCLVQRHCSCHKHKLSKEVRVDPLGWRTCQAPTLKQKDYIKVFVFYVVFMGFSSFII